MTEQIKLTDYEDLITLFYKIDKIWHSYFGKECPEFSPDCPQCRLALIYNRFKQESFDEVLK